VAGKVRDDGRDRRCVPTGVREKLGAERLRPMVTNKRFRPSAGSRFVEMMSAKLTPAIAWFRHLKPEIMQRQPSVPADRGYTLNPMFLPHGSP